MIILVNGPSQCGKSTAIEWMTKLISRSTKYALSSPLKRGVTSIFNIDGNTMTWFKYNPDTEAGRLHGISWRQAQINLWIHLSNIYGDSILTDLAIKKFDKELSKTYKHIIVDCGRQVDGQALMNRYGMNINVGEGISLLNIERPGYDFNDYREWVRLDCTRSEWLNNQYDLELYEAQIKKVLKKWKLIDE